MNRKSSINITNATNHSIKHNARIDKPKYLIDFESKDNEYYMSNFDKDVFLEYASARTKILINRTMQKSQKIAFWQEAVINLEKHHKMKDIVKLFNTYKKEFGPAFTVFQAAIHRDEGVFIKSKYLLDELKYDARNATWKNKEGIDVTRYVLTFIPDKNIFYNSEDKKWYLDKTFNKIIDISKLQKHLNYHAHVIFTRWNNKTGKMIRLDKQKLSKMQDITANVLGMQRGDSHVNKRLTHAQIKDLSFKQEIQKRQNHKLIYIQKKRLKDKHEKEKELLKNKLNAQKEELKNHYENAILSLKNKIIVLNEQLGKTVKKQNKIIIHNEEIRNEDDISFDL